MNKDTKFVFVIITLALIAGLTIIAATGLHTYLEMNTLDNRIDKGHAPEKCVCLTEKCEGSTSYSSGGGGGR